VEVTVEKKGQADIMNIVISQSASGSAAGSGREKHPDKKTDKKAGKARKSEVLGQAKSGLSASQAIALNKILHPDKTLTKNLPQLKPMRQFADFERRLDNALQL